MKPGGWLLLLLAATPAGAQVGRQALAAGTERYLLADYAGAQPLLSLGLSPSAGPLDTEWTQAVERLTDVLLVLRQDSLAVTWLRWAARLSPDFSVDEQVMPPAVIRAAGAARAYVNATPHDRFASTIRFEWPAAIRPGDLGGLRLAAADVPVTARVGPDQFLRDGESRRLRAGSYDIIASAPGYLPTRLTVEVLPGVTTVVTVSLMPETAGVLYIAARPWGTLLVDGEPIGYTPIARHRLKTGAHRLRLVRDGDTLPERLVDVTERQQVRVSWAAAPSAGGDPRVDQALAALAGADIEQGVQLLAGWLLTQPEATRRSQHTTVLSHLADAMWAMGDKDSARTYLRELVETDPFYDPPAEVFNPELRAEYRRIRRRTPVIALRAPADTTLTPLDHALPLQVAVGQPGEVRLLLRLSSPRPRDSVLAVLRVDSMATVHLPLINADSASLTPGAYAIEGELALQPGSASDLLQLVVEQPPVDTFVHAPPPIGTLHMPETRKGGPPLRMMGEAFALGWAAIALPTLMNDGSISGRRIPIAAVLTGATVAVTTLIAGASNVPIPQNIAHNERLRAAWEERNRQIADENARRRRLAPLRIRATRG